MADLLRLESCQALHAQNDALLLATPGQSRNAWTPEPLHGELGAAVLAPVVGDLEVVVKGRLGPECEGCGATADSVEDWNARAGNSPQDIAQFLISTWVEENGCPIPWSGSVCITAIVTGMPDSQRDALLALYAS